MVIRTRLSFALFCSLFAGCVLEPVSMEGRKCDDAHACIEGYVCREGTCALCADEDGDGELPVGCGGNDCDDDDGTVSSRSTELCDDQADNDCDGDTDTDDDDCACEENATRACGTCAGAIQVCRGGAFGACVAPAESCNGRDDDCSGAADDAEGFACVFGTSEPCTTSCGTSGHRACDDRCQWAACVADELCNGEDDDCDGARDEGFDCIAGDTLPCQTACGSQGTASCSLTCAVAACVAPAESCNGQDDDCDGAADDGFACVKGVADANAPTCTTACGTTGRVACSDTCGGYTGSCVAPEEICNGEDEDCDGTADDGLATPVGALGASARTGSVGIASGPGGLVAYVVGTATAGSSGSVVVAAGSGAALDTPARLPRIEVSRTSSGHPRDVEVAVGANAIAAVWIDDGEPQSVRLALASRDAASLVRAEAGLGKAAAGTRARISWIPGSPGTFVVAFLDGTQPKWIAISEDGSPGQAHGLNVVAPPLLTSVSVAPTADGRAALGYAVDAGGGAMRPQVAFVSPANGVVDPAITIDWAAPGALRDEGIELAGVDGLRAAFAVVDSSSGRDVRTVLAAPISAGQTAHATAVSPPAAPVLGLVRLAAQPGGALVLWTELSGGAVQTLGAAALFGTHAPRTQRLDEGSQVYTSSAPAAAQAAFDGAAYRVVWGDSDAAWIRRSCP